MRVTRRTRARVIRTYAEDIERQGAMCSFECGRCNSAGRTRNAVSWKLGQRVFGLDRDRGKGRAAEGRKKGGEGVREELGGSKEGRSRRKRRIG